MAAREYFGVEERQLGKKTRVSTVVHSFDDETMRDAWVKRHVRRNRDTLTGVLVLRRSVDKDEALDILLTSKNASGFSGGLVKHSFFNPKDTR